MDKNTVTVGWLITVGKFNYSRLEFFRWMEDMQREMTREHLFVFCWILLRAAGIILQAGRSGERGRAHVPGGGHPAVQSLWQAWREKKEKRRERYSLVPIWKFALLFSLLFQIVKLKLLAGNAQAAYSWCTYCGSCVLGAGRIHEEIVQ